MTKKQKCQFLIDYFGKNMPEPATELHYDNPFQLLVAVVLSAQCTDKRVNSVTPALFEKFPTPEFMASSHFDELFPYIRNVSYPNNKTKHLLGLSKKLVEEYHSTLPDSVEELQKLPGVGRKSANVIASVVYNQPAMAVDTHVFRVSRRIGLVDEKATTPLAVERELTQNFTDEIIPKAHHWLILHGRYTCLARKPKCDECGLKEICNFYR